MSYHTKIVTVTVKRCHLCHVLTSFHFLSTSCCWQRSPQKMHKEHKRPRELWPWTHRVPPVSASLMGLKAYATTQLSWLEFKTLRDQLFVSWRDALAIGSIGCSSGGHGLCSQNPYGSSQLFICNSSSGDPTTLTQTYIHLITDPMPW